MLDRHALTRDPEAARADLARRSNAAELLATFDRLLATNQRRREVQTRTDDARARRNALSKEVGGLMKAGRAAEAEAIKEDVRGLGAALDALEDERKALEADEDDLLLRLPNRLDPRVPTGASEAENRVVHTWGRAEPKPFPAQDHIALGERLGIFDFERAAKLSGARFPVARGAGARLERALINFFLDRAASVHGYTEVLVPYIVSRRTMQGTGQLPKFEADLFRLAGELNGQDAFLIPTAEVPVTNLHAEEIVDEGALPLRYCAFTPCFRAEAGSHGRDVRGLMRQHQFHKVELVQLTSAEQGAAAHEALTRHAEELLEALELPYRRVLLCSGDTGFSSAITYDLEVWLPSQGTYREISSCSWFTDFQGRRMNARYRPAGGKPQALHTINGSALAVGRTVIAVLDNHQQADGSVIIPEALRPWMGGLARIGGAE